MKSSSSPPPSPALALALRQLSVSGEQFRAALERHLQLGPSDFTALRYLYDEGLLTPRQLSTRMQITSGSVTTLLDRLEKLDYLRRNNNPHDRRSLLISITPAGQQTMRWVVEEFDAALRQALRGLPEMSAGQLAEILNVFAQALDARAASHTPGVDVDYTLGV